MGFGSVVAMVMFFLGVILVAGAWLDISQTNFETQVGNSDERLDTIKQQLHADITIVNSTYDNETSDVVLDVKNSGRVKFILDRTLLFRNGLRVPQSDFSVAVIATTDVGNSLIWDPGEVLRIIYSESSSDSQALFRIVTYSGAFAETVVLFE